MSISQSVPAPNLCAVCTERPGEPRSNRAGLVMCEICCKASDLLSQALLEQVIAIQHGPAKTEAA